MRKNKDTRSQKKKSTSTGRDVRLINHSLVVELQGFHFSLSKWPEESAQAL